MASVPSPDNDVDSRNDYIFDRRKDELKDALDVIAADVMSMNDRKKASAAVVPPVTQKVINCHAPAVNQSVVPPNIPVSVTQQKNARPEKLPIAPLPKQGRSGMAAVQQQQQQSPMLQKSVPVMVVPSTMAVSSTVATTAATPVTASQPVLFMKPGQSAPVSGEHVCGCMHACYEFSLCMDLTTGQSTNLDLCVSCLVVYICICVFLFSACVCVCFFFFFYVPSYISGVHPTQVASSILSGHCGCQ